MILACLQVAQILKHGGPWRRVMIELLLKCPSLGV